MAPIQSPDGASPGDPSPSRPGQPAEFVFPGERPLAAWLARHERDEVPGRWPYGLDALDGLGRPVRAVELSPPSRIRRAAHRAGLDRLRTAAPGSLAMSWDENMARRMVLRGRYDAMFSGVIWATDRPRDQVSPQVHRVLDRLTGVWVLSEGQLDAVRDLLPSHVATAFVPFGIDERFWAERPYPQRAPMVLSLGGDRDRDPATTMRAFARVAEARPGTELVLQTSQEVTAAPGVRVVRRVDHVELRELYARASVVAVAARPNLHVSGMTVSLEAMAVGRPVVVTGTPGMATYVVPGETGVHVPVGSDRELADAVIDLLDAPGEAAALGAAGAALVRSRFTSAAMAGRLADFVGL